MIKEIFICNIKPPLNCDGFIDGKLAHINLCGGNSVNPQVKECSMRKKMFIQSTEYFTDIVLEIPPINFRFDNDDIRSGRFNFISK